MKLIIAAFPPEKLPEVKQSLWKSGIKIMTVIDVRGCGQQKGYMEEYRGIIEEINLHRKVMVLIAVNNSFVEKTTKAIIKGARTGSIGDGKIFILDLYDCIRIRTGEKGVAAIGGDSVESKNLKKIEKVI